tara:strand:- start:1402 stop:1548 length:147 start_codon:yes stop_codon:yes gene_type:complete
MLDTIEKKLMRAKLWSTMADDYDKNIKNALEEIKTAKQKLEKNLTIKD